MDEKLKRKAKPRRRYWWLSFALIAVVLLALLAAATVGVVNTGFGGNTGPYERIPIAPLTGDAAVTAQRLEQNPDMRTDGTMQDLVGISTLTLNERQFVCVDITPMRTGSFDLPPMRIFVNEQQVATVANAAGVPPGCVELAVSLESGWYIYGVNILNAAGDIRTAYRFGVSVP